MTRALHLIACLGFLACGRTGAEQDPVLPSGGCGDGIVEGWEECDDANLDGDDGCRACRISEFGVASCSFTAGPRVAVAADGRFMVVWTDLDGDAFGVFGRMFDAGGGGPVFQANTRWRNVEWNPVVAALEDGSFQLAWESNGQDGDGFGVFARRFAPDGTGMGDEIQVNEHYLGNQEQVRVAPLPGGGAVCVWNSISQDGSGWGVFGRFLDRDGLPVGSEFLVNAHTDGDQEVLAVGVDAGGRSLVVWADRGWSGGSINLVGRWVDGSGSALGSETVLHFPTEATRRGISMAVAPDGHFVLVGNDAAWESDLAHEIGRLFAGDCSPLGPAFALTDSAERDLGAAIVDMDADGRLVVTMRECTGVHPDTTCWLVVGMFLADGSASTPLLEVGSPSSRYYGHDLSMAGGGGFVVAWTEPSEATGYRKILAQRFDASGNPLGLAPW